MPRVICMGEILIDQIAVETGVDYNQVKSWTPYHGGAPANVACALARLGTPSAFIGAVGQDDIGMELLQVLKSNGVDTSGVQIHPTAETRQVYVTRSSSGDRSFAKFSGDANTIFADTQIAAEQIPVHLFEEADFLVLGTLGLASTKTSQAIARALRLAEEYFVRVVVDLNWRDIFWAYPSQASRLIGILLSFTDFLKLSADESKLFFRTTNPAEVLQICDHLEGVIITDGDQECRYYLGEQQGKRPAFAIETVDTTGAGDAFLAGFLHQLCGQGQPDRLVIQELADPQRAKAIITYACGVGALTTLGMGAIASLPTDEMVQQFLLARG